ncbi:MAG: diacylglycerol/lipid kinase family protein [Chitinophagales bacterium]
MEKILFIVNPIAGVRNNINMPDIISQNIDEQKYNFDIAFTQYAGHAKKIAADAVEQSYDVIVAVGGDGSVNEIASQLVHKNVTLGIIPLGSGNGLALKMGLSKVQKKAMQTINQGITKQIDVLKMNNDFVFSNAGVGFEGQVIEHFEKTKTRGLKEYMRIYIQQVFNYKPFKVKIKTDTQTLEKEVFTLNFTNSGQYGYNIGYAPDAKLDDGFFELCIVNNFARWQIPFFFLMCIFNKQHWLKNLTVFKTKTATISTPEPYYAQLDGDSIQKNNHIKVQILPQALRVIVPPEKALT